MGLCRYHHRAVALPDAADTALGAGRTPKIEVQSNLRLLCGVDILLSHCRQRWYDHRHCARHRHSAAVLQLWWLVAVGLYNAAVHLPEVGLQPNGTYYLMIRTQMTQMGLINADFLFALI